MIINAPAKVNLCLNVTGKREDGYHDIETIFERISLCDKIEITLHPEKTTITCDKKEIPTDRDSLLGKTVALFKEKINNPDIHYNIELEKRIPIAAGLGGGSSDAASLLNGMNELSGQLLTNKELMEVGAVLGADIPFFLSGNSFACATGRGDIIRKINTEAKLWHILVKPEFGIQTKDVYEKTSCLSLTKGYGVDKMMTAFLGGKYKENLKDICCNDLQYIVLQEFPIVGTIISELEKNGAEIALLSGSGPTVFGLFDEMNINEAGKNIRQCFSEKNNWETYVVSTF